MQDKPTSIDLLEAIQDFLMKEIMPTVKEKDLLSFKTLISWNMLGVIIREIKQEEPLLEKEFSSLLSLLGEKADKLIPKLKQESEILPSEDKSKPNKKSNNTNFSELNLNEKKEIVSQANEILANQIRDQKILPSNQQVLNHVMETLKDKLAISNPRYSI
ncbi:MAG: hypothetical protein GW938_11170 [Leptospira sp.]|nr:hypothetical protein [Leptospira sp.]NCS93381.1 hypothetical protein [Leptospira sp.]